MTNEVDAFLEHHGVKGQHWGIRNKNNKKESKPLTRSEILKRRQKRTKIVITAARLAIIGGFVASVILSSRGHTSTHNIKVNRPSTVKDIINEEREVKLSSLRRMHKEGKMDKTQAENFIKILNDRYDRKIVDAVKNGMK